ncbi:MAG: hypothetical protein ABIU86_00765 [Gemmatimonadaceae bacterium]
MRCVSQGPAFLNARERLSNAVLERSARRFGPGFFVMRIHPGILQINNERHPETPFPAAAERYDSKFRGGEENQIEPARAKQLVTSLAEEPTGPQTQIAKSKAARKPLWECATPNYLDVVRYREKEVGLDLTFHKFRLDGEHDRVPPALRQSRKHHPDTMMVRRVYRGKPRTYDQYRLHAETWIA